MVYRSFFVKFFIAFCLVAKVTPNEDVSAELRPSPRIVNGQKAAVGQFPYQVSVRINDQHICGGALVAQNFVLTAAHCVYNVDSDVLGVEAGTVSRTIRGDFRAVSSVIIHPQYGFDNDIALLELKRPFDSSDVIKPIAITSGDVPAGESVVISGWGRIYEGGPLSDQLLYTRSLTTLKNEECAKAGNTPNTSILCLNSPQSSGFCEGDDGGPAVYKNILIGIASYITKGCGSITKGGFTNVSYYRNWIHSIIYG